MAKYEIGGIGKKSEDYSRVLRVIEGIFGKERHSHSYDYERGILTLLTEVETDANFLKQVLSHQNFPQRGLALTVLE